MDKLLDVLEKVASVTDLFLFKKELRKKKNYLDLKLVSGRWIIYNLLFHGNTCLKKYTIMVSDAELLIHQLANRPLLLFFSK